MKRRFLGAALLALTLILSLSGCIGKGTITGNIQNQTEYYVAGATITVKGTSISATSEHDTGRFTLTGVPAGAQTLVVTKWGFDTREYNVDVPFGGTKDVKITQNISVQPTTESNPQFIIYNSTGKAISIGGQSYGAGSPITLKIAPGEHDLQVVMDQNTYVTHLIAYMHLGEAYAIEAGGQPYFQIREQFGD